MARYFLTAVWPISIDDFYSQVVEPACEKLWLKDTTYGFPLVEKTDIHSLPEQDAFFLVCRFEHGRNYSAERFARWVSAKLGVKPRFVIEEKVEWGIPFIEMQMILLCDGNV